MVPHHLVTNRAELETVSRQASQSAYMGDNSAIVRVLGKYIMWVDTNDIGIAPHLSLNGFWESWITLAMARALRPGWTCVDVGANHGYYTLVMADAVGASGKVIAIEPNPRLCELLTRSVIANGFEQWVVTSDRAVTDSDQSTARLVVPIDRSGSGTLYREPAGTDVTIEVDTLSLDTIAQMATRIDLIKIDAEGSEETILRGGTALFAQNADVIVIVEINCARYQNPVGFIEFIKQLGFPLRYIDFDGSVLPISDQDILYGHGNKDLMLYLQRTS